jgi:hypothetical protein
MYVNLVLDEDHLRGHDYPKPFTGTGSDSGGVCTFRSSARFDKSSIASASCIGALVPDQVNLSLVVCLPILDGGNYACN